MIQRCDILVKAMRACTMSGFHRCRFLLLGLVLSSFLQAQISPTTTAILQHYLNQGGESVYSKQQQFLQEESLRSPVLRELEFRTETDEWDRDRQEYGFRFNLTSGGERRVEQSIQEQLKVGYELKEEEIKSEQLYQGYSLLGAYRYTEKRLALLRLRESLLQDRRTVYRRMLEYNTTVDFDQVLKVERDLLNIEQQFQQYEQRQQYLLGQLQLDSAFMVSWLVTAWVNVDSMAINLLRFSAQGPSQNADQYWREHIVDMAELEVKLEERKARRWLNFVGVKQAGRERLTNGQQISVGLGLRIPTASSNRANRNEAQLELLDEQSKQILLEQKVEERVIRYQEEFEQAIANWHLLQEQMEDQNLEGLLAYYQQFADVSPLSLLQIQVDQVDHQLQMIDWEEQVYESYLRLLDYRGAFLQYPEFNFASNKMESF